MLQRIVLVSLLAVAGKPPYPPRTLLEVRRLFDGMVVEIESTFYAPAGK